MKTIGRYEVLGEIGRGGFGVVYQARDPLMDRTVAIKLMLRDASDDPAGAEAQLARFRREAQITGNLNHPNLVTIFELGSLEGQPYLVMEYMRGSDLAQVIESKRPLTLVDRLDALTQAATGLARAHQEEVVHRDIKPHNIFLLEDRRVKVMDFGIARITGGSNKTLTRTGYQLGSFPWMAPEQFDGVADFQTDIWAFGVTAYELLTGAHPFLTAKSGFSTEEIFSRIVFARFAHPSEVAPALPPAVSDVLVRTMKKDRTQRYVSMDEVLLDLEALLGGERQRLASTLVRQADVHRLEGNADRALELVREALQLDNTNREGHQLRRHLQTEVRSRQTGRQVAQALQEANELVGRQQLGGAMEVLEKALALDSENQALRQRLGELDAERQRVAQVGRLVEASEKALAEHDLLVARNLAQQALTLDGGDRAARAILGRVEAAEKRVASLQSLSASLEATRATLALGEVSPARQQLAEFDRKAQQIDIPGHLQQLRGEVGEELKQAQRAAQTMEAAGVALQRQDFRGALGLLEALQGVPQQGVVQAMILQARSQLAAWASSFSSNAILPRVKELRAAGSHAEALAELRRAIEINPSDDRLRQMAEWVERECQEQEALTAILPFEQEIRSRFVADVGGSFDRIDEVLVRYAGLPGPIAKLQELRSSLLSVLSSSAERALNEGDLAAQQNLAPALLLATQRFPAALDLQSLTGRVHRNLERMRAEEAIRMVEAGLQTGQATVAESACAALADVPGVSESAQGRLGQLAWTTSQSMARGAERGTEQELRQLDEALRFAQIAVRLRGVSSQELARWIEGLEARRRLCSRRKALLESAQKGVQSGSAKKQFERELTLFAADTQGDVAELAFFVDAVRIASQPLREAGKQGQVRAMIDKAIELRPDSRAAFVADLTQPIAVPAQRAAGDLRMWIVLGTVVLVASGGLFYWMNRPQAVTNEAPPLEIAKSVVAPPATKEPVPAPREEPARPIATPPAVPPPTLPVAAPKVAKEPGPTAPVLRPPVAVPAQQSPPVVVAEKPAPSPAKPEPVAANVPATPAPTVVEPPRPSMMGLDGLRYSEITWVGSLATGGELGITGNRPTLGSISAGGLQPRPGRIVIQEPASGLELIAAPSAAGGWSSIKLRNMSGREIRRIRLRWQPQ